MELRQYDPIKAAVKFILPYRKFQLPYWQQVVSMPACKNRRLILAQAWAINWPGAAPGCGGFERRGGGRWRNWPNVRD